MMNATIENLKKIMNQGYLIEEYDNCFQVLKVPTYANPECVNNSLLFSKYPTFEEALGAICNSIEPPKMNWKAMVRFNKGLGPEMRDLPLIQANDPEEAHKIGLLLGRSLLDANPELKDLPILAVKVTPA